MIPPPIIKGGKCHTIKQPRGKSHIIVISFFAKEEEKKNIISITYFCQTQNKRIIHHNWLNSDNIESMAMKLSFISVLVILLQWSHAFLHQWSHHSSPKFRTHVFEEVSPYCHRHKRSSLLCATTATSSSHKIIISKCDSFGGNIYSLDLNNQDDGFLTAMSVPTFAAECISSSDDENHAMKKSKEDERKSIQRLGLEGIVSGAFILNNVFSQEECEDMINCCENELKFQQFKAGKNFHGAMQIIVSNEAVKRLNSSICPFVDLDVINSLAREMNESTGCNDSDSDTNNHEEYAPLGLNRRWRVYKYQPGGEETFAPHIDAGFPPSSLSKDQSSLLWDATSVDSDDNNDGVMQYPKDTISRLTVLMYLNNDFEGGQTKFYSPIASSSSEEVIASVQPKTGSILLFPQAVGEDAVEYARQHWPLHEGSPVTSSLSQSRAKYVIRSDILFTKVRQGITKEEQNDPLWKNDDLVRDAFLPSSLLSSSPSQALDSLFLKHCQELYNPHMGVENAGPLLYSLVRFTKLRKIVEIGAGYTTLWLLQALKENDSEMKRVKNLQDEGNCRLLDIPWTIEDIVDKCDDRISSSSLLCIDNCLHQRETATGAGAVARSLGLDHYLNFVKGDAFDMQFDEESIDLLWCDFGVGSRMKDFASGAWKSIKPGGFLVCHSTLTNSRTRLWLEKMRNGGYSEEETGIPQNEFVELSLLEPHKRYQNSITILQRRKGSRGEFKEPIYSEYA